MNHLFRIMTDKQTRIWGYEGHLLGWYQVHCSRHFWWINKHSSHTNNFLRRTNKHFLFNLSKYIFALIIFEIVLLRCKLVSCPYISFHNKLRWVYPKGQHQKNYSRVTINLGAFYGSETMYRKPKKWVLSDVPES